MPFAACTGVMPSDGTGGPGEGGNGGDGSGGSPSGGRNGACREASPFIGPAPIARLTTVQYTNTLRSLFPGVAVNGLLFSKEIARDDAFVNQGEAQNPSPKIVEEFNGNADNVAKAVVAKLPGSVGCTAPVDEVACGNAYVKTLLEKAFRRPATSEELQRYRALFTTVRAATGFADAIGDVVRAALQSPHFLYRIERGADPNASAKVALSPHELATRLSYFLNNNMPDAELMKAANAGALVQKDELEKQAKRLLASQAAREVVRDFQSQWLHLDGLNSLVKSPTLYPEFTAALKTSYSTSLYKFLDYQTWENGGRWRELITDKSAFVDQNLAPIYGLANTSTSMNKMTLDDKRTGLLSQAGLLAALAHVDVDSPTERGLFVLRNILCMHVPDAPADVSTDIPKSDKPMTMRQKMEDLHSNAGASCKTCHKLIDGIGFGFNNFDSLGRYRTQDNGLPTDDRGNIVADSSIDGEFKGVVELSEKIASSIEGRLCYASQVLAYGRALARENLDECAAEQLLQSTDAENPSLQDLMVGVAVSEGFRSLDKSKP